METSPSLWELVTDRCTLGWNQSVPEQGQGQGQGAACVGRMCCRQAGEWAAGQISLSAGQGELEPILPPEW